ncbi:hypothetical protein ABH945_007141 [Paraburkholderia sp. GAS333]
MPRMRHQVESDVRCAAMTSRWGINALPGLGGALASDTVPTVHAQLRYDDSHHDGVHDIRGTLHFRSVFCLSRDERQLSNACI